MYPNKLCERSPQYAPPLQVDLRPLDLESGVRVTRDVAYLCANFILPRPLSVRDLGPMYATDRQADRRQTSDVHRRLMLLTHKTLVGHSPEYTSDLLTSAADVSGRPALRTASRGDFIVPRTNRKFGERAFCVAAPRAWNRLPPDLRRSTQTFRRHLKTFLFIVPY